jgi:HTH-type transcriptional regulator/antitoxin MqsA
MDRFKGEAFTIDYAGLKATVEGLSGRRCNSCGEVEFDNESARRYATAGDELVLRERERQSKEIRRIRRKLGLSQMPRHDLPEAAITHFPATNVARRCRCRL